MPGAAAAEEVRAQLRRTVAAMADVRDTELGWTAQCPGLGLVHSVNRVQVTRPADPPAILALADETQRALPFRHVRVEVPDVAAAFAEATPGWKVEREVHMVLGHRQGRAGDPDRVVELAADDASALYRTWVEEEVEERAEAASSAPDLVDQLVQAAEEEGAVWRERRFGVRDASGRPVSLARLRTDGAGTAWVEDVYTLPHERGRGHGRAVVARVVDLARSEGNSLTFIIADDDDWPKTLYADLGFEPVARVWHFTSE